MPVEFVRITNLELKTEVQAYANPDSIRLERWASWEQVARGLTLEFTQPGPSTLSCVWPFKGVGTAPNVYAEFVEPLTEMLFTDC
jgi:hypothetical protein